MSDGIGDQNPTPPATSRRRDWPCLRQFGVFLENRVGALNDLLRRIERHDLKVVALTILDSVDCAVARIVLNHYERGLELLELGGVHFFETECIGLLLPNVDQPHTEICTALMSAELNVYYMYPLNYRRQGRGAIAIYVDNLNEAVRVLQEQEMEFVTEDDLANDDEFF